MAAIRYTRSLAAGLLTFFILAAARKWHADSAFGALDSTPSFWLAIFRDLLFALSQTLPAFVAGLLARNSGWVVGAGIGFMSWLLGDLVFGQVLLHHSTAPGLLRSLLGAALGTAVVGAFAGAAGVAARTRPNNSFKPKPLRGSA